MTTELEHFVRAELKAMRIQLDRLSSILLGDPADPDKPGVPIRLDRLEQSNKLKNKVMMLLATGIFTALGSIVLVAFGQLVVK
jgi:hypothetical protein